MFIIDNVISRHLGVSEYVNEKQLQLDVVETTELYIYVIDSCAPFYNATDC